MSQPKMAENKKIKESSSSLVKALLLTEAEIIF